MATPYDDIFGMFLNDIKDKKLVTLLSPYDLGDTLEDYLGESADIRFKRCVKDLSDRDDILKQFNVDLTNEEKRILAKGMRLKWLTSNFVANEQLLNARLTTKDYNVFSPANQLKTLLELEKRFESELKNLITKYLYDNMIRGV